jgi:cyd operon protein YbgT
MWYFSWILGLGLAMTFGILNAIWYEVREGENAPTAGPVPGRSRRHRP